MKPGSITKSLWILLLLLVGALFAETPDTGRITGTVYDLQTGDPVVGVSVWLLGTNQSAMTDSLGQFAIEQVRPGKYSLRIDHPDYAMTNGPTLVEVRVDPGRTTMVSVSMAKTIHEMSTDDAENYKSVQDRLKGKPEIAGREETRSTVSGRIQAFGLPAPLPEVSLDKTAKLPPSYHSRPAGKGHVYSEKSYPSLPPFDMFFRDYGTNGFVDTRQDRFSTFATDVDDASYTLVRRYLLEGNLPPRDAIRVEEFLNHFDYGYNLPKYERFRVFTEMVASPFDSHAILMKIGVKGKEIPRQDRKPLNLTFVIDVSGSMGFDNRLELLKRSLRLLVAQLDRHDRVGIVDYGSCAHVVLEPVAANRQRQIMQAINSLYPGGSTNAEAGLKLGYQMADRQYVKGHTNRIILCSDGVANVGRTSPEAIMQQVKRYARKGITLSTFGFGMGNYNDVLLEQLAQKGNGRYAYVNDDAEARKQFVDEFVSNMQVLARDVKIQVEFNPEVVASYRLIGYENRDVPDHLFRDSRQDGGEIGAGHEVTALYELMLNERCRSEKAATVFVRWKNVGETEVTELSREVSRGKMPGRFDRARPELRLAVVAARFAELLKETEPSRGGSYDRLVHLAEPLVRELPGEQTRELVKLINQARDLLAHYTDWRWDESDDDNYRNHYR